MDPSISDLCNHRGFVLRPELLAWGHDDREIRRWLSSGNGVALRRGAYCDASIWEAMDPVATYLALSRAAQMQAAAPAALSHVSALAAFGVEGWDLPRDRVHVTRFDGRGGRREAGIVQHRGRLLVDDVTKRHDVWVTSATRTALDLTTVADLDRSVVVLDALLHGQETTVPMLTALSDRMRHWPGTLHTDLAIRLADGRSESAGETLGRLSLRRQHFHKPVLQFEVLVDDRVVARLDFAWPELKVWVEFDGQEKYLKYRREGESVVDAVLREKAREDMIRRITGWTCVRITWNDLASPRLLVAKIMQAMAAVAA